MRLVAVSQRVDRHPERDETRDALDQRIATFLLAAGFLAVPIPNAFFLDPAGGGAGNLFAWLDAVAPHGLVLSGGNDIGSCTERDHTERGVLDYARDRRLPVLGVCRGMQLMGTWAGIHLKAVTGHVRVRHQIDGTIPGEVNSYHTLGLAAMPEDFVLLAKADDGEIEAIAHRSLPWEGWMWHPEREHPFMDRDVVRLKALFNRRKGN